jgi:tripeptidyl-peptidase I
MKLLLLAVMGSLAASVAAVPAAVPYTVHEKRNIAASASKWEQKRHLRLNRRSTIPMKIALAQPTLFDGHELLMAVSDPTSDSYGKHWTPAEVLPLHPLLSL